MPEIDASTPLGERLRAHRRKLGLTIAQVAEKAGLSMPYVSNLERGRGNPTLEALTSLAEALDLPVALLLGDDADATSSSLEALLSSIPDSLDRFSKTPEFIAEIQSWADRQHEGFDELRQRVLLGMAAAPRRSSGEPTTDDWRRLLDAYRLILRD